MMKAMPPIQKMAAARWKNLSREYMGGQRRAGREVIVRRL
jgi:hypothetical protein